MAHAEDDRLADMGPDWEALARYLAGESDDAERRRIDAELSAHPDRAALLRALDGALVRPRPVEPSPPEIDTALAHVLARRGERTPIVALRSAHRRWRAAVLRAAAAVLVVAGGAALWQRASTARARPAAAGARGVRVATAIGQVDTLQLPDGSRVILGPRSALAVLPGFGAATRTVALQGGAYFEVVHDAARPFVVRAGPAQIRDVGTSFSVESAPVGGVQVAVATGAVSVRPDTSVPTAATLQAGDRGTVAADGLLRVERGVVGSGAPAWTAGRLELRDVALADAAGELRRWFGLELRVDDPTLARRRVTASFEAFARPDVGSVIAATLGARARQRGDTLWIEPAPAAPPAR
jgi:transmembrane sensor